MNHLLACALSLTLAACAGAPAPPPPRLDEALSSIARSHHGKVALFAENLTTGATAGVRPDDAVKSASTIKLAVLLEGFQANCGLGKTTPREMVAFREAFSAPRSPSDNDPPRG